MAKPRDARFKVVARIERSFARPGTVTISRSAGTVTIRQARCRKTYTLPLSTIAEIVVSRIQKAEAAAKRAAKRQRRSA